MQQTHPSEVVDHQKISIPDWLGSWLFLGGIGLFVFSMMAQSPKFSMSLPGFWYRSESFWPFIGIGVTGLGYFLQQRRETVPATWNPTLEGVRFERVVIYTREQCHLCDVAKDTLHRFAAWLPVIEEIDIDESSALTERYGEMIPVVEIDGRERFRGAVSELLLKRLIEATPPQRATHGVETT